jgi:hypothetical protein
MELKSHTIRTAVTRASADATYALLADVPRSVAHFPDLAALTEVDGLFQWQLKKVGVGPLSFQSAYAARYAFDPVARLVSWRSVPGRGNTEVSGSWTIDAVPTGTRFALDVTFALDLPLPALLRSAAEKVLAKENDRILGQYLAALQATLDRTAQPAR